MEINLSKDEVQEAIKNYLKDVKQLNFDSVMITSVVPVKIFLIKDGRKL